MCDGGSICIDTSESAFSQCSREAHRASLALVFLHWLHTPERPWEYHWVFTTLLSSVLLEDYFVNVWHTFDMNLINVCYACEMSLKPAQRQSTKQYSPKVNKFVCIEREKEWLRPSRGCWDMIGRGHLTSFSLQPALRQKYGNNLLASRAGWSLRWYLSELRALSPR